MNLQHTSTIIGVTGHRPPKLGGYSIEAQARLMLFATGWLDEIKPSRTISGMALGWDMAVAEASFGLGIPFTAAVPFEDQDSRWPLESRVVYKRLLSVADRVEIVSPGPYAPEKLQIRNQWMVDHATRMAALWDGSKGGTGNCVAYIQKRQVPWDNLWPTWLTFREYGAMA